jgi:hypothetical protein
VKKSSAQRISSSVQGQVEGPLTALVGAERDEISQLVLRIKQADLRHRAAANHPAATSNPAALAWAQEWQLPQEVHEFFVLETAA